MSAQVAADLRAAADVLERDGWTQGKYREPDGACCTSEALIRVTGTSRDALIGEAYDRAMAAAGALVESVGAKAVWLWNDAPGRTAAEVIAALRAAADRAEAEQ